jgi:murein tripeptide amidase MpaA
MKPLVYSTKKAENDGIGWFRGGEDVCYYQNSTKKKSGSGFMYSLTFTIEFPFDNDEVYLAHCFPYTYRDSKEHVDLICNDNKALGRTNMKDKVRKTELCKSIAGNTLDLIIITNFNSVELDIAQREAIVITGRVHPGESNSSFIAEGIMDFLVGETETAIDLRNKYVFKIIPMLNPDGVILGNYR